MFGTGGARPCLSSGQEMPRRRGGRSVGPRRAASAVLAVLPGLVLAACTGPAPTSTPTLTSETTATACTDAPYVTTQGVGFSTPRLPAPTDVPDATVSVAPSSIDDVAEPPTVSVIAHSSGTAGSEATELRDLKVGDTAAFFGYEIRITAICPAQAGFELVAAP